jgi:hypothetical protein
MKIIILFMRSLNEKHVSIIYQWIIALRESREYDEIK